MKNLFFVIWLSIFCVSCASSKMTIIEAVNEVVEKLPNEFSYLVARPGDSPDTLRWKLTEANKQLSLFEAKIKNSQKTGQDIIDNIESL